MTRDRAPRWGLVPVLAAMLVQLGVLYAPSGGGAPPFAHFDKLVHCAVFALPVFFALLVRLPFTPVVVVLAAHAPVSEIVQATVLPKRSGDPWDVVADLVGVCLGVLAAHLATRGGCCGTPSARAEMTSKGSGSGPAEGLAG